MEDEFVDCPCCDVYGMPKADADEVRAAMEANETAANCTRTAVMLLKSGGVAMALDCLEVGLDLPRTNPQGD